MPIEPISLFKADHFTDCECYKCDLKRAETEKKTKEFIQAPLHCLVINDLNFQKEKSKITSLQNRDAMFPI